MKRLKRILSAFLLLCLFLTSLPMAAADGATYSGWFKSSYLEMENLKLLPESFKSMDLTQPITRSEICDVAVLAMESVTGNAIDPAKTDYFPDTSSVNIAKAKELGIVGGYEDGTFRPNNHLTRQEFFVIVLNFCRATSFKPNADSSAIAQFPDSTSVAGWAKEAAEVCVKYGYVNGSLENGKSYLKPTASLSRQEAMTMLLRCHKGLSEYYYYVSNAGVVALSTAGGTVTKVGNVSVTDATGSMYVNTSKLNVRSFPGTEGSIIGSLKLGADVSVTGICSNGWIRISYSGKVGYVSGGYLSGRTGAPGMASEKAIQIANLALTFIGMPYVWGAESPKEGFDCSGLVYYVFGQHGIKMNRVADAQMNQGTPVEYGELLAGDLVFFGYGTYADHVGIYIGNGNFVHAANPRSGVRVSAMSETYYANKYLCAKRIVTD